MKAEVNIARPLDTVSLTVKVKGALIARYRLIVGRWLLSMAKAVLKPASFSVEFESQD